MAATFQVKTVTAESLVSMRDSAVLAIYMNYSGLFKIRIALEVKMSI